MPSSDTTTPHAAKPDAASSDHHGPYLPVVSIVLLGIGLVIVCLDVLFAKGVFDVLVNENETVSWMLALGVSLAGAMSAMVAGAAAAVNNRPAQIAGLAVWVLIGIGMAATRCFNGTLNGDKLATKDVVLALLMVFVYLGGIALYFHAREVWRPRQFALMFARRRLNHANRQRGAVEAAYVATQQELTDVDNARPRIVHELNTVHASIEAMQRKLHAVARDRIVMRLADPRQSSLFRSETEVGEPLPQTHRPAS